MPTSVPTRILVAPSGFKESLSPEGVCQAVAAGVRRLLPGAVVVELPLVDGGHDGPGHRRRPRHHPRHRPRR